MDESLGSKRTRGHLPHIDVGTDYQFVTWRLADSLTPLLIQRAKADLAHLTEIEFKKEYYKRVETLLDESHGSRLLSNPLAARIVQDSLLFGHGTRYNLAAWVIMPTHVHCLLAAREGWTLSRILHDHKSFTSHEIGKKLNRSGQLWQIENFDRYIRDADHFQRVRRYVEWNPVKAKLCADPKEWPYSSANAISKERLDLA